MSWITRAKRAVGGLGWQVREAGWPPPRREHAPQKGTNGELVCLRRIEELNWQRISLLGPGGLIGFRSWPNLEGNHSFGVE
jgi:hypothetical protein